MAKKGKDAEAVKKYRVMLGGVLLTLIVLFAFYLLLAEPSQEPVKNATLVDRGGFYGKA